MGRKLVFLVAGCLCFLKQDLSWSSWCIFILKVLLPYMYIYIYMFIYVYTFGHVWPLQQSAFWNVKVNLIVAQREVRQGQIHLSWRRSLMLWQFSNAQLGVWVSSRALQTTNYIFLLLIYVTAFCHLKKCIEYSYIGTDFWKLAGDMVKIWKFTSSPFPFPGLEFKEVWAKINAHMCTEHTVAFIQCYVCIQEKKKRARKKDHKSQPSQTKTHQFARVCLYVEFWHIGATGVLRQR